MAFPSLGELEILVGAGSAVAVIVEGEDVGDDAWIYGDVWFGGRAREVRFLPQDGWDKVVDGVRYLRGAVPGSPVFGLIDRDFTDDAHLDDLVPAGVYRSKVHSVENHLLDAGCWHSVFELVMRHRGGLPRGWSTPAEVGVKIDEIYQRCLPAAAYNFVVWRTWVTSAGYSGAPGYIQHLGDIRLQSPDVELRQRGRSVGYATDLGTEYAQTLAQMLGAPPDRLPCTVNGKMVLHTLLANFQTSHSSRSYAQGDYINLYLDRCSDPPPDAEDQVERILADARAFLAGAPSPP